MKLAEAKQEVKNNPKSKLINTRKKVEIIAGEKHPAQTGSKRMIPEHMVEHLKAKGMIDDGKKQTKKD